MALEPTDSQVYIPSVTDAENAVRTLLLWLGEDPQREGLLDTPSRVARALREIAGGKLSPNPEDVLSTTFSSDADQMIIVRGVRFTSVCEHHLLPFSGEARLGYIPSGRVIGLSKIPRLIVELARRPQIQEGLTQQIAEAFYSKVRPLGVGVEVVAKHSCMGCRGAKQPDAEMITSALLGCFRVSEVRAEFFANR